MMPTQCVHSASTAISPRVGPAQTHEKWTCFLLLQPRDLFFHRFFTQPVHTHSLCGADEPRDAGLSNLSARGAMCRSTYGIPLIIIL